MLTKEWKQLKNGSDVRGVAIKTAQNAEVTLTEEKVERIAAAFVLFLCKRTGKRAAELTLAVGRDSRISGPMLLEAAVKAFCTAGVYCYDLGLMSTPAMFMACVDPELHCDGTIQITASHLPYERNGMKFFTPQGGLESADIEEILESAMKKQMPEAVEGGSVEERDFLSVYAGRLAELMRRRINSEENYEKPLTGLHIVVDAGNGAGGFYADKVLQPLGADISGSRYLEPDGYFPNHVPNPENEKAMAAISESVLQNGADFGVIFDTDVDRAAAVDSCGQEINRNRLIALISAILLRNESGATIVTDSVTSSGLKEFIESCGGVHYRYKRGYKNVINEAIRLNKSGISCPLAIETSGHAALRENYFLDDGAYLVTVLIAEMACMKKQGKKLEELIKTLKEPVESREFRMPILTEDFTAYGNQVLKDLESYAKKKAWRLAKDSFEGVRVSFGVGEGEGWFLLRLSLHDPIMPLNVESDCKSGVYEILRQFYSFIMQYGQIDSKEIEVFLQQRQC